jgi:hypothetical protein
MFPPKVVVPVVLTVSPAGPSTVPLNVTAPAPASIVVAQPQSVVAPFTVKLLLV